MKRFRLINTLFIVTIIVVLVSSVAHAQSGGSVTRTFSPPAPADGSSGFTTLNFTDSIIINDVNVIVTFSKEDDETCDGVNSGGSGWGFPREISMSIESPNGSLVDLVFDDDDDDGPTYTGFTTSAVPNVTVVFDDEAATQVGGPTPVSGTFRPEEPLSLFDSENAQGTWTFYYGDNAGSDVLCIWEVTIVINNVFTGGESCAVPHLGVVLVNQPVTAYDSMGGQPVYNSDGSPLVLPHDWDKNGFDTYVVTNYATVDGQPWVTVFLGSCQFVAIPFDQAKLIEGNLNFN